MVALVIGFASQPSLVLDDMVPIGGIIVWFGAKAAIPANYAQCDGSNGTPDLREKFVRGVGAFENPGDIGGADSHLHPFLGNGHVHSVNEVDGVITGPGTDIWHAGNDGNLTESADSVGLTDGVSSLPPFHALAYIMRIS